MLHVYKDLESGRQCRTGRILHHYARNSSGGRLLLPSLSRTPFPDRFLGSSAVYPVNQKLSMRLKSC